MSSICVSGKVTHVSLVCPMTLMSSVWVLGLSKLSYGEARIRNLEAVKDNRIFEILKAAINITIITGGASMGFRLTLKGHSAEVVVFSPRAKT